MKKPVEHVAKETLFVIASLVCMISIIVITSIANAGLDAKRIFTMETLSNVILNAAITIFATVSSVPSGISSTKLYRHSDGTPGKYLQDFEAYNAIRDKIEPKRYMFNQWHKAQYEKECHDKRINYLLEYGIVQAEQIISLSREQILTLTATQAIEVDGHTVYFKALTTEQIAAALKVVDGKVKVHKLSDFYFLYADGKGKKTFYDQAYRESLDESSSMVSNIIVRIMSGLIITCIFTGLVIDRRIYEGADVTSVVLKMIINMVARIFNAISSTIWGYLIGKEHTYKLCYYLNGRAQFLQAFDSDKNFVYKDIQEIAAEELAAKEVADGTRPESDDSGNVAP